MELILKFDTSVRDITPRQVRNFCGSITDDKFSDVIMYHGSQCPPICYKKPFEKEIRILFTEQKNYEACAHLHDAIAKNTNDFYGRKIKKLIVSENSYTPPFFLGDQMKLYHTRTPIIITTNKTEYHLKYNMELTGRIQEYVEHRIRSSIAYQVKCYLGITQPFTDLKIELGRHNIFTEKYKGESPRCAFFGEFKSNYSLPELVGYATGMGYGQLVANRHFEFKD